MAAVLAMISVLILPKSSKDMLTYKLSHKEFRCRCGRPTCHYTIIADSLRTSFAVVRTHFELPLIVNSGYRCQGHNHDVGGSPTSSHTTGHAIDISTKGLAEDDEIYLISLLKFYFDFVKVYPNFVHAHNHASKP